MTGMVECPWFVIVARIFCDYVQSHMITWFTSIIELVRTVDLHNRLPRQVDMLALDVIVSMTVSFYHILIS